jgi:2-C-methyl-D-erythritol 4-phosphate cytidylyltransferase
MSRVTAIIVAAGEGERFGSAKQFSLLKGKTVLDWSLETFERSEAVEDIILVLSPLYPGDEYLHKYRKITAIAKGGKKRQDSVYAGLLGVDESRAKIVLVHDGARPLVDKGLIERIILETREKNAVVPVIPVEDTIKRVEGQKISGTEDRIKLFRSQTPQGFSYSLIRLAFQQAMDDGFYGTDDASLVERMGNPVFVVPGDRRNIKITLPEDLKIAEALIED